VGGGAGEAQEVSIASKITAKMAFTLQF